VQIKTSSWFGCLISFRRLRVHGLLAGGALAQSVTLTLDVDDLGVVQEPIEDGGG
jgi:hypothetical protein